MLAIDAKALANQRQFTAQGGQPTPYGAMPPSPYGHPSGPSDDPSRRGSAGELRPFSQDQYYSTRVLPAAWRGEYSSFQREVRKSHGAQTLPRPSFQQEGLPPMYKSVSQQRAEMKQPPVQAYAPAAAMGRLAGSPDNQQPAMQHSQGPGANGAPPPTQYTHSPYGAPPTPATTGSEDSRQAQRPQTSQEYLNRLSMPPYLTYRSPLVQYGVVTPYLYPTDYHADRLQDNPADNNGQSMSTRTPSVSLSSGSNSRPVSQQWTPPSQRPGATPTYQNPTYALPPPRQEEQRPKWPAAVHQTPQEFQNQLTHAPSIASREGAHLRMMRDKGYMQPVYQQAPPYGSYQTPYQHPPQQPPPQQQYQHRNSLGQPFGAPDTHVWTSPKAPTASPISDPNTPGVHQRQQQQQAQQHKDPYQTLPPPPAPINYNPPAWGPHQPRPDLAPLNAHAQAQSANGQGPMLPQMQPAPPAPPAPGGGHEAWRYTR